MSNVSSSNSQGVRVPKLRFPGFEGEWKERKFSEFTWASGKRNKENLDLEPYAITSENGFIPQNEAHNDFGYMKDADRKAYIIVTPNSFAYNPARINIGSIGYYEGAVNVIVSSLYEVFQTADYIDDRFLWHWFKSNEFPKWIERLQEGSVRLYFYYDKLCECHMFMPSIVEQRKIAEFLKIIDRRIKKQQQLVEALKLYKRGVQSAIFQEDKKEAQIIKIGDVTQCFSGGTPKSSIASYYGGHIPFIRSGELHQTHTELFLTDEGLLSSSAKLVYKGDLLYALYGATSGEVAISKIDGAINQAILCIRSETINIQYLAYWLDYQKQDIVTQMLQGGQGNLSAEIVKDLSVPVPSSDTQQKRADFLNELSRYLSKHEEVLAVLSTYKSALLQQLFT